MKKIILVPVKNEAWIIRSTLSNYSSFADHIIIADQGSTDSTKEICESFEKAQCINNPHKAHTNQVRFLLLDEARKIPGNNLIIYLDADELISPSFVKEIEDLNPEPGTGFQSAWIQLAETLETHRIDGVWEKAVKQFAFIDDRKIDYNRNLITNDHSNRIPETRVIKKLKTPILHLQYMAKKRCEIKQAFNMCSELISGRPPERVNYRYGVTQFKHLQLAPISQKWWGGIEKPNMEIFLSYDKTKLDDIFELFSRYSTLFFEPLDIWEIKELRERFELDTGRTPTRIKKYPKILTFFLDIKNKIKYSVIS